MLILQNINLELKSALRTKYWFYQTLLYLNVNLIKHMFGKRLIEKETIDMYHTYGHDSLWKQISTPINVGSRISRGIQSAHKARQILVKLLLSILTSCSTFFPPFSTSFHHCRDSLAFSCVCLCFMLQSILLGDIQ